VSPGHEDPPAHHHDRSVSAHTGDDRPTRSGRAGARLRALLHGHRHDHAGAVDEPLGADREAMRALWVSLAALAVTAGMQFVVVLVSGSVAVLADTFHNLADASTAIPLGLAFWLARRPPTRRYTYGFGRAEDLAGVFIVTMITLSIGVAAWEAVERLVHPQDVSNVGWVIAAGLIGAAGNELVGSYRMRVGRRVGSAALVADGHHARTDGISSLAVVAGGIGVALGFPLADPIAGLLITVALLGVLKSAASQIFGRLMDRVDPDVVTAVEGVLAATPCVEDVGVVHARWVGHELRVDADIVADADLTLAEAHAVAEDAHHRLLHGVARLTEATIHVNPCGHDGRDHHALTAHHFLTRPR
jgi:cation diffusion facilitator family transporter